MIIFKNKEKWVVSFLTVIFLHLSSLSANGQVMNFSVKFEELKTDIDPLFMNNKTTLLKLDRLFSPSVEPFIESIQIRGYASPEGSYELNNWLSVNRAYSLRTYLLTRFRNVGEEKVAAEGAGRNWPMLREYLSVSDFDYRDEVIY
ncbi:MAG: hypothetical protein ACRCZQ_05990, partial [Bacteroidales bacterium]